MLCLSLLLRPDGLLLLWPGPQRWKERTKIQVLIVIVASATLTSLVSSVVVISSKIVGVSTVVRVIWRLRILVRSRSKEKLRG